MEKLTVKEILGKIDLLEPFEGISSSGGFKITIRSYLPFICTSLHSGGRFKEKLDYKVNLSSFQRWQEEEPYTDKFISELPITISALDSKFEYDLNKVREDSINKRIWRRELSSSEEREALRKYDEFYEVVHFLVGKLEFLFDRVFFFDIHSYNYKKSFSNTSLPLFNIGTYSLNEEFRGAADYLLEAFKGVEIDCLENTTEENHSLQERGELARYISCRFQRTGFITLGVKKVYCNENSGIYYQVIANSLKKAFYQVITDFIKCYSSNLSYNIIDNLNGYTFIHNEREVAREIAFLMQKNYIDSNRGEYSAEEISYLISNKKEGVILERLKEAYIVYVSHGEKIVACGVLMKKGDRLEAKMLNVDLRYRGLGLAQKICDIREDFAKKMDYRRVYIESLRFQKTLDFHSRRGFYQVEAPRELNYSIYMCKDL